MSGTERQKADDTPRDDRDQNSAAKALADDAAAWYPNKTKPETVAATDSAAATGAPTGKLHQDSDLSASSHLANNHKRPGAMAAFPGLEIDTSDSSSPEVLPLSGSRKSSENLRSNSKLSTAEAFDAKSTGSDHSVMDQTMQKAQEKESYLPVTRDAKMGKLLPDVQIENSYQSSYPEANKMADYGKASRELGYTDHLQSAASANAEQVGQIVSKSYGQDYESIKNMARSDEIAKNVYSDQSDKKYFGSTSEYLKDTSAVNSNKLSYGTPVSDLSAFNGITKSFDRTKSMEDYTGSAVDSSQKAQYLNKISSDLGTRLNDSATRDMSALLNSSSQHDFESAKKLGVDNSMAALSDSRIHESFSESRPQGPGKPENGDLNSLGSKVIERGDTSSLVPRDTTTTRTPAESREDQSDRRLDSTGGQPQPHLPESRTSTPERTPGSSPEPGAARTPQPARSENNEPSGRESTGAARPANQPETAPHRDAPAPGPAAGPNPHAELPGNTPARVEAARNENQAPAISVLQSKAEALLKTAPAANSELNPQPINAHSKLELFAVAVPADAGKGATSARAELPAQPGVVNPSAQLARDSQPTLKAVIDLSVPVKVSGPEVSAPAKVTAPEVTTSAKVTPTDLSAPGKVAAPLPGFSDINAGGLKVQPLDSRTTSAITAPAGQRVDAASIIASSSRSPLSVVSPVTRGDVTAGGKPGSVVTTGNGPAFGGAIGIRGGDAAISGRVTGNGRALSIDASGGRRYFTGVEIGLLIAAAGIAKSRMDARAQDKGTRESGDLTGKSARQFSLADGARRFPGRELTLSALLALTGAARVRDIDHTLGMRSTERSVRIERSIGSFKREKIEVILPQISLPNSESDNDPSRMDNGLLGFLPAAPALLRARRKADAANDEQKLEKDEESQDTSKTKIPVLRYRRVHQVLSGETLVSIAESRLNDANLAWLIADINASKITERRVDCKRVVEILQGQSIELPLAHEIAAFYKRDEKEADPDNLVTIVVEEEFDRDRIEQHLNEVLGMAARSTT